MLAAFFRPCPYIEELQLALNGYEQEVRLHDETFQRVLIMPMGDPEEVHDTRCNASNPGTIWPLMIARLIIAKLRVRGPKSFIEPGNFSCGVSRSRFPAGVYAESTEILLTTLMMLCMYSVDSNADVTQASHC